MPEYETEDVEVGPPIMRGDGTFRRFRYVRVGADIYRFSDRRARFVPARGSFEVMQGVVRTWEAPQIEADIDEGKAFRPSRYESLIEEGYVEGELTFMLNDFAIERARDTAEERIGRLDEAEFEPEEWAEMKDDPYGPFNFLDTYEFGTNPPPRDPSRPNYPIGRGPMDQLRDAAEVFLYDLGFDHNLALGPNDYVLVGYDGLSGYLPPSVVKAVLSLSFNVSESVIDPNKLDRLRSFTQEKRDEFERALDAYEEGEPLPRGYRFPKAYGAIVA